MPDRYAPAGKIWQCMACGKTSHDLYDGPRGWDAACVLNAQLVEDSQHNQELDDADE